MRLQFLHILVIIAMIIPFIIYSSTQNHHDKSFEERLYILEKKVKSLDKKFLFSRFSSKKTSKLRPQSVFYSIKRIRKELLLSLNQQKKILKVIYTRKNSSPLSPHDKILHDLETREKILRILHNSQRKKYLRYLEKSNSRF